MAGAVQAMYMLPARGSILDSDQWDGGSRLLITVMSGGHKQCIGAGCQCKINMVPDFTTGSHPRTLLYQIETCGD